MLQRDEWQRKGYINEMTGDMAVQVMKIRLNMWPLKSNYKKKNAETACPKCKENEDNTEHVLQCFADIDQDELRNTNRGQWDAIVKAFNLRNKMEEDEEIQSGTIGNTEEQN